MTVTTGTKPWPQVRFSDKSQNSAAVVIIGAGFSGEFSAIARLTSSGICIAIDLIKRYNIHNFVILEKSTGFGGTWKDNVYPGAACDDTAQKYNLYKYVRFATEVTEAKWDDVTSKWHTTVSVASGTKEREFSPGYTITSDFVISAVGQLNRPQMPNLKGLDSFKGKTVHSARWDWTFPLEGKRVAVVGNGASAVQIVPELAKMAATVDVYQRTASWITHRGDRDMSDARPLLDYLPGFRSGLRTYIMKRAESYLWNPIEHPGSKASQLIIDDVLHQMNKHLPGPERAQMREHLTPSYPPGCKRILRSDDFYATFALPHVSLLVDPISHVSETGISTRDGTLREYDLIVCATGFKTLEFLHPIKVTGEDGIGLDELWKRGAQAYRGISVPHMPNFAIMYGPNTNLGHNSIIYMIEAQSKHVAKLVDAVVAARSAAPQGTYTAEREATRPPTLVVKRAAFDHWNKTVQAELKTKAWSAQDCESWYKDGDGTIVNNWSGQAADYGKLLARLKWADYEGGAVAGKRAEEAVGRVAEEHWFANSAAANYAVGMALAGGLAWTAWSALSQLQSRPRR